MLQKLTSHAQCKKGLRLSTPASPQHRLTCSRLGLSLGLAKPREPCSCRAALGYGGKEGQWMTWAGWLANVEHTEVHKHCVLCCRRIRPQSALRARSLRACQRSSWSLASVCARLLHITDSSCAGYTVLVRVCVLLLNSVSLCVNAILELWPYMVCRWRQKVEGASSVRLLENKICWQVSGIYFSQPTAVSPI